MTLFSTLVAGATLPIAAQAQWICSVPNAPWVDRTAELTTATSGTSKVTSLQIGPSKVAQSIDGFGGCFNELGWKAMAELSEADRGKILKELFSDSGCRFNICRMPIGASDYALDYYSLDDTPGDLELKDFSIARDRKLLIPYIKAAMAIRPQLKVWGSAWTPPAWMKNANDYKDANHPVTGLKWEKPIRQAYAHYLAKAAQAYRQEGLNFYAMHAQNEPASAQIFPSCQWNGEQLRDFIRDDLGPVFQQQGLDTEIWLGTINNRGFQNFISPTLDDKAAAAFVKGVGVQWDAKESVDALHAAYPSVKLMQTETECGGGENNWRYACYTFSLFKKYLDAGIGAYMQWNMVLEKSGASHWGWKQCAMVSVDEQAHTYRLNPQFYIVKHISHFVDPGAHRLEIGSSNKDALAFVNPDGKVVLVWVNPDKSEKPVEIQCVGQVTRATLPGESFNTFVIDAPQRKIIGHGAAETR